MVSTRPDPVDQSGSFSTVFIVVRACSARAWRHSVLSLWNRRAEGGCVISLLQLPAKVCQKFPWNVKLNKNGMCFEHLEEDKYHTPSGSMLWTKFVKKSALLRHDVFNKATTKVFFRQCVSSLYNVKHVQHMHQNFESIESADVRRRVKSWDRFTFMIKIYGVRLVRSPFFLFSTSYP